MSLAALKQNTKTKNPLSINQWTDAYLVFICIKNEKEPSEAPHLLKYLSFLRKLHKLHRDSAWRAYDESFRKLKETTELPWQQPIEELKGKCITLKPISQISQPFRSKQAGRTKFCYAFNQGDKRKVNPCSFAHICQVCRGQHPKYKCKLQTTTEPRTSHPSRPKQIQ